MVGLWRALILGSGFEEALEPLEVYRVDTPFGSATTVYRVSLEKLDVLVLPRHGPRPRALPTRSITEPTYGL